MTNKEKKDETNEVQQEGGKEEVNLTKQRDDRLIPAVRELFAILYTRKDLPFGSAESITTEEVQNFYYERYIDTIVPLLLKHDVRMNELEYFFQLVNQSGHFIKEIVTSSLQMSRDMCDAQLYGIKDINQLSLKELDNKMKELDAARKAKEKTEKDLPDVKDKV